MAGQPVWAKAGASDSPSLGGVCAEANAGIAGGSVVEWAADATSSPATIGCYRLRD
jgi:hypothetical protein